MKIHAQKGGDRVSFYFETGMEKQMIIPQSLADSYLAVASGAQIKVMLCLIRFAGMPLTEKEIARQCNLSEEEVTSAIAFWTKEKVLSRRGSTLCLHTPETVQEVRLPVYTGEEILSLTESDKTFGQVLEETQGLLGKILSHNDASILYGIYDHLGFSGEMVMQLIGFCAAGGKTGFRYIERVALDWHDRGIDSFEKADAYIRYLEQIRDDEHTVARMFGIEGRALSKKEKEHILRWREEMTFSMEMIEEAYNVCVDRKGKLSFPYINGILSDWYQRGVKTPEDVKEAPRPAEDGLGEYERAAIAEMGDDLL